MMAGSMELQARSASVRRRRKRAGGHLLRDAAQPTAAERRELPRQTDQLTAEQPAGSLAKAALACVTRRGCRLPATKSDESAGSLATDSSCDSSQVQHRRRMEKNVRSSG
jgi:hypothetical protein